MSVPSAWGNMADWMRMVARDLNPLTQGYLFIQLDDAPASPTEGFVYYDRTLHKARCYDGTSWQNFW